MFHDIFSKKQEREQEKISVTIDYREKNSLVPAELARLDFILDFKQLPVADYLVNNVAIERKTISDLKSSIINKRIFQQLEEIKQYENHFLIIEGYKDELFNNEVLHENAARGFLLSLVSKIKTPVVFSKDEKETAKYIRLIANKKESKEHSINPKKITLDENEQKQYILESFPGIGPVSAKKLIDKFKTLSNIFNASEENLKEILGKNASNFFLLINSS